MHNFGDIISVNTRRLKKLIKAMGQHQGAQAIAETYQGVFVIVEDSGNGNLVCVQHAPKLIHCHQRIRNVPSSLARRIRKANPEHLKLLEVA